ncbi:MAG: YkgJ family cysteine cluster protein [Acidobacteriota bacterium]
MAKESGSGTNLIERLRRGVEAADAEWEKAAARVRPGDLLCREGCFGCCLGSFEISLPEALVLRDAVSALPEPERTRVRERAARLVAGSASAFPGDPVAGVLDPDRSEEKDAAFFDALEHIACPLLDLPSGRCAVYASRPVTCRTYGLAWREDRAVVHPACPLNLPDATIGHTLETAVDVAPLLAGDQARAELARAGGMPSGAATTVAHALTGTAFAEPPE